MSLSDTDRGHLDRAVELAADAVAAGDEPFGSVLVSPHGERLFEDHNHVSGGDQTQHPEFAIARWAAENLTPAERAAATVYTSGEHCAMCSAAHAWVGLGRIVFATSTTQLSAWRAELGAPASPIAPLGIAQVAPSVPTDGPFEVYAERLRALHAARVARG